MRDFTTLITDIDAAAATQLRGVAEVHGAIRQLDDITQQNATMVEQLARSASEMLDETAQVTDALRVFRLTAQETRAASDAVALRRAAKVAAGHSKAVP